MLLKDFDLDLKYIYDEQKIQEQMRINCISHNEATQMDYNENWNQKRRIFGLQTRCISSMYARLFGKYKNGKCWKISIECVDEVSDDMILYLGGVCKVQPFFDVLDFNAKTNYEKKRYALEKLFEGICKVVDLEQWDLQPFLNVKEQIIACDYNNE